MPLIPLAVGFGHALKSSAVKNTVLSNRDAVHARIEDVVGEKEVVVDEKEKRLDSKNLKKSALGTTIMTSAIIGFLDTAATQYFTNMKHLSSMEAAGLKSPWLNGSTSPLGILNKLHFAKMGVTARYLKNSVNALCCIGAVTILQTPMEELFPAEKYGITSNAFTTILAGTMGGFITNGLEVVYKNQIKHADFVKMQTPNMYVATKNLINEHGVKSLFKGYKYSIACSIIAFGIINGIESLFESIEEKSQKTSSNPSSFFKPANPQTKNETPVNHIPYKP